MGAVHKETPGQNLGYHEFESVTLSDERCVKYLIKYRSKIYPSSRAMENFSDIMIAIYIDLDKLIQSAPLSRLERHTVNFIMYGYGVQDLAELWNIDRRNADVYLTRAAKKIAALNSKQHIKFFERKYHNRLVG